MKKNILVTGSHRSGSTWTGYVISKANKVRYIHEPFNIDLGRKNVPLTFWFEYMEGRSIEDQHKVKKYIESYYKVFHVDSIKRLRQIRKPKDIYNYFADLKGRLSDRSIIKDPIAIMSTEWLYQNYNTDVLVLIRHPAAFVASLKVKNWQFDFNNFLNQDNLMSDKLSVYKEIISEYSKEEKNVVDQGILLWNIIHDVILYYQSKYQDAWLFVKHEDLSTNPLSEFEHIFSKFNLDFSKEVKSYITETTKPEKETAMNRNSRENTKSWKNRLNEDEIAKIKSGTEKVWKSFYTEDDW